MALSPNLRGALFMTIAMAGFTINDALTKIVVENIGTGQIMLVRGFFAMVLVGLLAWSQGALRAPRGMLHPMVGLRVVGELGSTISFLAALSMLPLANVSSIMQALPLAVTMGAALFLSEPVGWRRWLAIIVGFTGVLIIVRPGFEGFNIFALFALLAVLFAAMRDIATRKVPREVPSLLLSTVTATVVTIAGAVLMVPQGGWSPMTLGEAGLLLAAAVLLLFGYQFIILAMRFGEISFVAPFRYTALIWAIALGVIFLGESPDGPMLIGAAIVIGSGLYTLYRERVRNAARPVAASTTPGMAPDGL